MTTKKYKVDRSAYITIIQGIGGWNSCLMVWDEEMQTHIPEMTGFTNTSIGSGLKTDAIQEAIDWAQSDEYRLVGVLEAIPQ